MSTFRAHLSEWIGRARTGEDILVTDRGVPVARLVGVDTAPRLEQLVADGVIGRAPKPRPSASDYDRVPTTSPVADLVGEMRR